MRLRFTLLIAIVVVIIATTTVVVFEYSTRVSLPTPKQGDEIILAAGSNFTLGPNQTRSFMFVENSNTRTQYANFIGCFKSLNSSINIIGTVDPRPPTKGLCFLPSATGNDPRDIVAVGGPLSGPVINSPCSGNCLIDGGEVSLYNNNTVSTIIVVTYIFFFDEGSIVPDP
jgi:hypothetical protein